MENKIMTGILKEVAKDSGIDDLVFENPMVGRQIYYYTKIFSLLLESIEDELPSEDDFIKKYTVFYMAAYYNAVISYRSNANTAELALPISLKFLDEIAIKYNLSSDDIATIYDISNEYTYLVSPCDWIGQSCYEVFNDAKIKELRKYPEMQFILFTLDCIFYLKKTGEHHTLNDFKSLILIDFTDFIEKAPLLAKWFSHFLDEYNTFLKIQEAENQTRNTNHHRTNINSVSQQTKKTFIQSIQELPKHLKKIIICILTIIASLLFLGMVKVLTN